MVSACGGRRKAVMSESSKGEKENGGGRGMAEYEESRAQRIKENMDRMKSLGILDLSKKIKPEPKRPIAKNPSQKKKTPCDDPPRRSTRLKEIPPVSYTEKRTHLTKDTSAKDVKIHIEKGQNPETYTEEEEKLLGDCEAPWTLSVDGYDHDGHRIYDPFGGKSCHQCRQKTLGHRTKCSKCKAVTGQFCGDCLYMRYGENVMEVNQNPNWICPVCRGICNCSRCRREKGWAPTGQIYRKVLRLGFKSVAHYLIQTFGKNANLEETADINSVSAVGSFSTEDKKSDFANQKDGMESNHREVDSDDDYCTDDLDEEEEEDN